MAWFLEPGAPPEFPDPGDADADGLVALGGDLSPQRLLAAYDAGIFPWYDAGLPPLWWSPDPRAVLPLAGVHVPRRLARTLRAGGFTLSWNRAFAAVMAGCAERNEGTWILPEMGTAYVRLHELGHAHSLEVWDRDGALIGGLYGVQRGGLFAAESMFHRRRDASKVALVAAARSLHRAGIELFDVQYPTDHLEQFGVVTWPRPRYLAELARVRTRGVDLSQLVPAVD